jgi:hypothetical protein
MTVEAELAQLLIRMGTERGLDVETILSEMAQSPLPSFIDADAVRGSMLEAVESWWRADLEERLEQLRRQFQMGGQPAAPVTPAAMRPTPPPAVAPSRPAPAAQSVSAGSNPPASESAAPIEDATIHDELEPAVNEPNKPAEVLPRDATMIWNTNHG